MDGVNQLDYVGLTKWIIWGLPNGLCGVNQMDYMG